MLRYSGRRMTRFDQFTDLSKLKIRMALVIGYSEGQICHIHSQKSTVSIFSHCLRQKERSI